MHRAHLGLHQVASLRKRSDPMTTLTHKVPSVYVHLKMKNQFSSREIGWKHTTLKGKSMLSTSCPTQNGLNNHLHSHLWSLLSHNVSSFFLVLFAYMFVLYLTGPVLLCFSLQFCVCMGFLCMQTCFSVAVCILYAFSFSFFSKWLFCAIMVCFNIYINMYIFNIYFIIPQIHVF